MSYRTDNIIFLVILACFGLALTAFSTLCIVSPNMVAGYYRRQYHKSKLTQKLPFSSMILRPWFLIFLRVAGVFGFAYLFVVIRVILNEFSK